MTNALKKLLLLRGKTFEWKEPEQHGDLPGRHIGFVAQEVEPVFPEWVGTDRNGFKEISIRGFEALTVESFREIVHDLDELKTAFRSLQEGRKRQRDTGIEGPRGASKTKITKGDA